MLDYLGLLIKHFSYIALNNKKLTCVYIFWTRIFSPLLAPSYHSSPFGWIKTLGVTWALPRGSLRAPPYLLLHNMKKGNLLCFKWEIERVQRIHKEKMAIIAAATNVKRISACYRRLHPSKTLKEQRLETDFRRHNTFLVERMTQIHELWNMLCIPALLVIHSGNMIHAFGQT